MKIERHSSTLRAAVRAAALGIAGLGALMGGVLSSTAATAAASFATKEVNFDIPAQSLESALLQLSKQADVQVMIGATAIAGQKTEGVRGRLSVSEALSRLLSNTGLTFETVGNTVTVRAVAAAETNRTVFPLAAGTVLAAGPDVGVRKGEGDSATGDTLAEVVVTGSHIRGVQANTAQVLVLDRAYINSTGLSTVGRLVESLPQNFALANQSGVLVPGVSNPATQGQSINLRGLGEGTTLVLLNGRRMAPGFIGSAVDISALPLTAVDRVEVLTDGASAIYGSDAIGGVVNFILRKNFEGAESRLRVGVADGGVNEYRVGQVLGNAWESGNALVSLEFYKRDMLSAQQRDFVPSTSTIGSLLPRDKNYSVMFTGRQDFRPTLSVFADALFTKRESYNEGGQRALNDNNQSKNPQGTATVGLDWQLASDWQLETSVSYSRNKLEQVQNSDTFGGGAYVFNADYQTEVAQSKIDGQLFAMSGGYASAAIGAEWRGESIDFESFTSGAFSGGANPAQTVRSAFAELSLPLVGTPNARRGVHRLELSLAGRFDDYSNFGSSFDPRVGFAWEPAMGLRIRGSYGTSYKAPRLADYDPSTNYALAITFPDPDAPGGLSRQLWISGTDVDGLEAQNAKSFSTGLEFTPEKLPGLELSANYYRIDYSDQIAAPPSDASIILGNPGSFGALFTRDPTAAQVAQGVASGSRGLGLLDCDIDCGPNPAFDPASIDVVIDFRRRNLSLVKTSGLDFSVQHNINTVVGDIRLGLTGTRVLELKQQITASSDPADRANTFHNPPYWRARASFGWNRDAWTANLFANYTGSYRDNRFSPSLRISSYTTLDTFLSYDFGEAMGGEWLSGVVLNASVQNLFDRDPPRTAIVSAVSDMGFDPTNASPLGRFTSVEIIKSW